MSRRSERASIRPFAFGWVSGTFRAGLWSKTWSLWMLYYLVPLLTGWLLKLVFDALESSESINRLLLAIGMAEAIRWALFGSAIFFVVRWWLAAMTLFRTNMLEAQTVSGGPKAATLPGSPAEAITRFTDDARDGVLWPDSWVDGSGVVLFGVGALVVMATIDARAALIALVPLAVVTVVTRALTPRLHEARAADRAAGSRVNAFLGEVFSGQLAFRLAGRERAAVAQLEHYTAIRRRTAVRDAVLQQAIDGMSSSTGDVTIGLTLLVLVPAVQSGQFSAGDMALFVAYAVQLGEVPRYVARLITAREQAIVAYGRMGEMVAPGRIDDLVHRAHVTIEAHDTPRRRDADPARVTLDRLELRGVTAVYESTQGGVRDIDLTIEQGSFTVITGGVGAGKSTLLRAMVGLVPLSGGSVVWNGVDIDDVAAWCVPPNVAHLPQLPRLFSESLADNVLLGRDPSRLAEVIDLVSLGYDLESMPDGSNTMVGARGLRLSGGQAQRVATARSLLTQPELLVVDDLSSALDVATERELWDRLASQGVSTIVAVSHRRLALDRADQVITLDNGRITSVTRR